MTPNENQIDVLINYNDNIDKVTKHIKDLDTQIKTMQSNISKASNNNYNQQKGLILAAQQKIKLLQSELKAETNNLNTLTKLRQDQFVKELKNTHELANSKTESNKKFKAESEAFAKWGTNFNKQQLAEELAMYKTNQRLKTTEAVKARAKEMADKRAEDRTWKGAWFGSDAGSTFGHKFLTTAQYAAAGTALFGIASAVTSISQAALEADLNMRTMSAVLKLNTTEASALDSQVRKLGETYGGTTNEIEQVAIALGRAGVKTQDITDATKVVLAMARLTGDTFEQSASAVISYQQVFGDTKNITELGNKLAYIANVSRLSTQDIGTFSNYALAAAKDVGLTEDAVGGLAAAFSNAGVNASTIGTQIRRFTSLLTESSTDVTNFFRGIGVNQANLLADLQKGGDTSNKAMLEFVNTLSKVDKAKFTNLVGQMDILAGNSLQLMRNNSNNITKYIKDLQTGVSDQLENTKVILESYIVTYESLWNKIKNIGSDALQSDNMKFFTTAVSTAMSLATGDIKQAEKEALGFQKNILDASLRDTEKAFKEGKVLSDEYLAKKAEYIKRVSELEEQAGVKSVDISKRTTSQQVAGLELLIKKQSKKVSSGDFTGKALEAEEKLLDNLVNQYVELAKVSKAESDITSSGVKKAIAATLDLDKQLTSIREAKSANLDVSEQEKMFNDSANASLQANNKLIADQVTSLSKYADVQKSVANLISISGNDATKYSANILNRLKEIDKTPITKDNQDKLLAETNVLKEQLKINEENIVIIGKKNSLIGKNLKDEESAQRKAESEASRRQKIIDDRLTAEAKIQELTKQILGDETDSISKAQSRLGVDAALLSLAYERYTVSRGTKDEEEKLKEYRQAEAKYLETSVTVITQVNKEEEKRKALQLDLNSGLDQAIEGEQVRLGIIEKSTDSEYEKLRVKIEQGKLDGLLVGNELVQAERRLAELKVLQSRKKDVHTLAMEYQRELQDQETMGYIAAKAGLASLESGMMNFFDVTSEGWLDWHSLASSVLTDIYKQLLQQLVIKQLVSGIAGGISSGFGNVGTAMSYGTNIGSQQTAMLAAQDADFKVGGIIPTKGYASGGILSGGTGIRDDIYLGNVSGTRVFAMGGEFITRKSSVNDETKGTLDYINKTGTTPSSNAQVNVPVKINIENNTGQNITADMIESMTKPNDKGEYEKVVSIILKASQTDPRVRSMLKGR